MFATQVLHDSNNEDETRDDKHYEEVVGFLIIENIKHEIKIGDTKIGRDPSMCSIVIESDSISRLHAVIESEGKDDTFIYDAGSTNHVKIEKKCLKPHCRYKLDDGNIITLGDVVTKFVFNSKTQDDSNIPLPTSSLSQKDKISHDLPVDIFDLATQVGTSLPGTLNSLTKFEKLPQNFQFFQFPNLTLQQRTGLDTSDSCFDQVTQCQLYTSTSPDSIKQGSLDTEDSHIFSLTTQCQLSQYASENNQEKNEEEKIEPILESKNNAKDDLKTLLNDDQDDILCKFVSNNLQSTSLLRGEQNKTEEVSKSDEVFSQSCETTKPSLQEALSEKEIEFLKEDLQTSQLDDLFSKKATDGDSEQQDVDLAVPSTSGISSNKEIFEKDGMPNLINENDEDDDDCTQFIRAEDMSVTQEFHSHKNSSTEIFKLPSNHSSVHIVHDHELEKSQLLICPQEKSTHQNNHLISPQRFTTEKGNLEKSYKEREGQTSELYDPAMHDDSTEESQIIGHYKEDFVPTQRFSNLENQNDETTKEENNIPGDDNEVNDSPTQLYNKAALAFTQVDFTQRDDEDAVPTQRFSNLEKPEEKSPTDNLSQNKDNMNNLEDSETWLYNELTVVDKFIQEGLVQRNNEDFVPTQTLSNLEIGEGKSVAVEDEGKTAVDELEDSETRLYNKFSIADNSIQEKVTEKNNEDLVPTQMFSKLEVAKEQFSTKPTESSTVQNDSNLPSTSNTGDNPPFLEVPLEDEHLNEEKIMKNLRQDLLSCQRFSDLESGTVCTKAVTSNSVQKEDNAPSTGKKPESNLTDSASTSNPNRSNEDWLEAIKKDLLDTQVYIEEKEKAGEETGEVTSKNISDLSNTCKTAVDESSADETQSYLELSLTDLTQRCADDDITCTQVFQNLEEDKKQNMNTIMRNIAFGSAQNTSSSNMSSPAKMRVTERINEDIVPTQRFSNLEVTNEQFSMKPTESTSVQNDIVNVPSTSKARGDPLCREALLEEEPFKEEKILKNLRQDSLSSQRFFDMEGSTFYTKAVTLSSVQKEDDDAPSSKKPKSILTLSSATPSFLEVKFAEALRNDKENPVSTVRNTVLKKENEAGTSNPNLSDEECLEAIKKVLLGTQVYNEEKEKTAKENSSKQTLDWVEAIKKDLLGTQAYNEEKENAAGEVTSKNISNLVLDESSNDETQSYLELSLDDLTQRCADDDTIITQAFRNVENETTQNTEALMRDIKLEPAQNKSGSYMFSPVRMGADNEDFIATQVLANPLETSHDKDPEETQIFEPIPIPTGSSTPKSDKDDPFREDSLELSLSELTNRSSSEDIIGTQVFREDENQECQIIYEEAIQKKSELMTTGVVESSGDETESDIEILSEIKNNNKTKNFVTLKAKISSPGLNQIDSLHQSDLDNWSRSSVISENDNSNSSYVFVMDDKIEEGNIDKPTTVKQEKENEVVKQNYPQLGGSDSDETDYEELEMINAEPRNMKQELEARFCDDETQVLTTTVLNNFVEGSDNNENDNWMTETTDSTGRAEQFDNDSNSSWSSLSFQLPGTQDYEMALKNALQKGVENTSSKQTAKSSQNVSDCLTSPKIPEVVGPGSPIFVKSIPKKIDSETEKSTEPALKRVRNKDSTPEVPVKKSRTDNDPVDEVSEKRDNLSEIRFLKLWQNHDIAQIQPSRTRYSAKILDLESTSKATNGIPPTRRKSITKQMGTVTPNIKKKIEDAKMSFRIGVRRDRTKKTKPLEIKIEGGVTKRNSSNTNTRSAPFDTHVTTITRITRSTRTKNSRSEASYFSGPCVYVAFTGFECESLEKIIYELKGKRTNDLSLTQVMVADKIRRTVKLLCAVGLGLPITSSEWLWSSMRENTFLNPWDFILKDEDSEVKWDFELKKSLEKSKKKKLLEGYSVFATESTKPPVKQLLAIIECCGGSPIIKTPETWPKKTIIVSCLEDKNLWPPSKFRRNVKQVISLCVNSF